MTATQSETSDLRGIQGHGWPEQVRPWRREGDGSIWVEPAL